MRYQGKHLRMIGILVVLLVILLSRPAQAAAPQTWKCGGWRIVASPNLTTYYNALNSVGALSPSDVWAVGSAFDQHNPGLTLVEHWNGTRWQVVSSPNAGTSGLQGITVLSTSNIWAVGYSNSFTQTLIEHWDGRHWRIVPSPSVGSYLNVLSGVSAVSPSDIWAVGWDELGSGTPFHTLIEHWNGAKWRIVPSPNPGSSSNYLYGVSEISASDVWAGGTSDAPGPLAEHWDGTRWKVIHASRSGDLFEGVSARSASDVWAVGGFGNSPWSEHWDGTRWHVVPIPHPLSGALPAVAIGSQQNVWAVGSTGAIGVATLTEHWDGTQWQRIRSPNKQDASSQVIYDNYLDGVVMTSAHTLWAVGYYQPHDAYSAKTLIEFYC